MDSVYSNLPIIDLHEDLLIAERAGDSATGPQTGFDELTRTNVRVVIATGFADVVDPFDVSANSLLEKDFLFYNSYCKTNTGWKIVRKASDITGTLGSRDTRGIIVHIEGLNTLSDSTETFPLLEKWYALGLRSIGPQWVVSNSFGGGNRDSATDLSSLGEELIRWCVSKGVIYDMAHMNEPTFWSAMRHHKRPPFVSHTGVRSIINDPRNITDEQLKAIAENNGMAGVFFSSAFLNGSAELFTSERVVDHIVHIIDVAGIDHIGLGSDYGGITSSLPSDMPTVETFQNLFTTLKKKGLHEEDIEKIAYKNALRVLSLHLTPNDL